MRHARALIESRPMLARIPDQGLLASDAGAGTDHVRATRGEDGAYAFVYSASGRPFDVDLTRLSGERVRAWWYDPRSGAATSAGELRRAGFHTFTPPTRGRGCDWVLVLDDVARGYMPPGE